MLVPSVPVHLHDAAVGPGHLSPIMISVGMGAVPVGIMALAAHSGWQSGPGTVTVTGRDHNDYYSTVTVVWHV
jgi:hypothetical protein